MSSELKMVKIFNKGKRTIAYSKDAKLLPNKNANVEETVAKTLLALFPEEIIELSEIKIIDKNKETEDALKEATDTLENAKKEISEKDKQINLLKEDLKNAQEKIEAMSVSKSKKG